MKQFRPLFICIVFSLISFSSLAWWGLTGHRVVAEIADQYLTKKARKAISEMLGTESMAMASNWPDFIKSDSTYNYLSSWHYINFRQGLSKSEFDDYLQTDTLTDAYTKLNFLVAAFSNKELPLEKKRMYLKLLIHIVGDIHQPMHTGRLEDLGGNRIKVLWFNEPTNLHSVWDDKLIEMQKLSYTEYAAAINYVSKEQCKAWQQQPVSEWLYESYQAANQIYAGITQPDQKLGYHYNYEYLDLLNQQLLKGGVHLAGLLNQLFG